MADRRRIKYVEHLLDIYGVTLLVATTARQWRAMSERLDFIPSEAPTAHGAVWGSPTDPLLAFWVDMESDGSELELIETCAHEAAHAAGKILIRAGHQIGEDEPHAYLVGWLTRWLWKVVHDG